ncbi:hypothetical protein [Tenacibaculum sp. MAR_2009_124]|uniref:hypothetical protein n=1 Tax=Tenacibaculum sp. MAR_2009_124 TaxID=1250059 RepID=UPI0015A1ACEA|nr:hypothetical protein [Tenacibaculum sp. MAR_2009_124]
MNINIFKKIETENYPIASENSTKLPTSSITPVNKELKPFQNSKFLYTTYSHQYNTID